MASNRFTVDRQGWYCYAGGLHSLGPKSPDGDMSWNRLNLLVLKSKVYQWLTSSPWNKWVVAFTSARLCDGGAGATYVVFRPRPLTKRLRKKRKKSWIVFHLSLIIRIFIWKNEKLIYNYDYNRLQVQGQRSGNIGSEVQGSTFKVILEPPKLGTSERLLMI